MARLGKTKFSSGLIRTGSGALIALVASIALTLWSSFFVCLGLHPESTGPTETVIPILAVLFAAAWCGYRVKRHPWWAGVLIGICSVAFWFASWCYFTGQLTPKLWLSQSIPAITDFQWIGWGSAVAVSLLGGILGAWLRRKSAIRWTTFIIVVLAAVPIVMLGQTIVLRGVEGPGVKEIAHGLSLKTWAEQTDGTTIRLLTFDLDKNPDLSVGLSSSAIRKPVDFVSNRLSRKAFKHRKKLVCACNAGFVDSSSGWSFGIGKASDGPRFHLTERQQDTSSASICWVRPLRDSGKSVFPHSTVGSPMLKCSRTSIGWSDDSSKLYILIVRDPDGEIAAIKQQKGKYAQTGGWNTAKVQRFWEDMGVSNAVLIDSGDSTQLSYLGENKSSTTVGSGYLFSQSISYWRNRPLRLYLPMLPATLGHNGVKNCFYVEGK